MKKMFFILFITHYSLLIAYAQPYGWYPQNSGTANNLNHVSRVTYSGALLAAGNNGTILKTTDYGGNWMMRPSGTNNHLKSILFYSSITGFITGSVGTILKTSDEGNSWSMLNTLITNDLYSIARSGIRITAVGDNGTIIRSSNNGATWSSITSPTTNHLRSILFTTSTNGWIVGNNGTILRSNDGGNSWYSSASPTSNNLNSITRYIYDSTLWVAGNNGTILKSTNEGATWLTLNSGTALIYIP